MNIRYYICSSVDMNSCMSEFFLHIQRSERNPPIQLKRIKGTSCFSIPATYIGDFDYMHPSPTQKSISQQTDLRTAWDHEIN